VTAQPRSPWLAALFSPLNLAMLGLAVLAGLISAWWLFPLGVLFWAVMVISSATDPRLRLAQTLQTRAVNSLAQRFQPHYDRLERAQAGLYRSLGESRGRTRQALEPVRVQVDALVERCYQLCQRMTALENHRVVEQANAESQKDLVKINELIAAANDPEAKREYEQSRQSLEKRQADLQTAARQLDRFEALLVSLQQELERVQTEAIRLQSLDTRQIAQPAAALLDSLKKEEADIKRFEDQAAAPA
jgi:hypothetical protein